MKTDISRSRALLVRFSLFVYNTPIPILVGLIPILVITISTRSASSLIFAIAIGAYVSLLFWLFTYRLAVTWQGVLITARSVPAHLDQLNYRVHEHFAVLRSYLRFELGDVVDDLLSVETPAIILQGGSKERRSSTDLILHGLRLGLMEQQLRLFGYKDPQIRDVYPARLEADLNRSENAIQGILGFVVESYSSLEERIIDYSMRIRPNPSLLDAIESHKTAITLVIALTLVVAAAVLHYPLGLSI